MSHANNWERLCSKTSKALSITVPSAYLLGRNGASAVICQQTWGRPLFQHRTTSRWRTARGARAFGWLAGPSGLPLKLKDDPSCSEPNRDPFNLSATHAGGESSLRRPKLPSREAGSYMGATSLPGFRRRHDRRMAVIEHILIAHRHRWRGPYRQNAILL